MLMRVIMWRGKKLKSLTLIEVMVAVSISVILLGVSIPIFSRNAKNQELTNEAEAISAFYSRARNYAFHPERVDVASYKVVGENCRSKGCNRLAIYAISSGGDSNQVDDLLMPDIIIEVPGDISFNVGDGKADVVSTEVVEISFKDNSKVKAKIEINSIGNIDVVQAD